VRLTGSARRGDGELVWRLGAAARGGVLTREGVSGNVGEIWQLLGGEIEMWLTSIEGNNGGWGGGVSARSGGGDGVVSPKLLRWLFSTAWEWWRRHQRRREERGGLRRG
jgi:hypothetical protein